MLDEKEIDAEIARLEYVESSYPNYAKLANLYTIKNQMNREQEPSDPMPKYSYDYVDDRIGSYGESDFLMAVEGKDAVEIFEIMDDLMDTLQVSFPRAYNSVMNRIRAI